MSTSECNWEKSRETPRQEDDFTVCNYKNDTVFCSFLSTEPGRGPVYLELRENFPDFQPFVAS